MELPFSLISNQPRTRKRPRRRLRGEAIMATRSSSRIFPVMIGFLLLLIACVAPGTALVDRRLAAARSSSSGGKLQHAYSSISIFHYRRRTLSLKAAAIYEDGRDGPASVAAASVSSVSSPKETPRMEANRIKSRALDLTRRDDFQGGLEVIRELTALAERIPVSPAAAAAQNVKDEHYRAFAHVSQNVDDVVQNYANLAFAPPYFRERDRSRVLLGTDAIRLQVTPRRTSTNQKQKALALVLPLTAYPSAPI
jgi:hypothetical protein